jgi:hypothetical protein
MTSRVVDFVHFSYILLNYTYLIYKNRNKNDAVISDDELYTLEESGDKFLGWHPITKYLPLFPLHHFLVSVLEDIFVLLLCFAFCLLKLE